MTTLNPRGIPYEEADNGLPYMSGTDPVHEIDEWTKALAESIDPVELGAAPANHTHTPSQVGMGDWGGLTIAYGTQNIPPETPVTINLPVGKFSSRPMIWLNIRSGGGTTGSYVPRVYEANASSFGVLVKRWEQSHTNIAHVDWIAIGPKA